jgi:hypothetical protein
MALTGMGMKSTSAVWSGSGFLEAVTSMSSLEFPKKLLVFAGRQLEENGFWVYGP